MLSHAVTLTFDLLTLNFYSTSGVLCLNSYKIWAKSNNPRLSYWRFTTFLRAILGVGRNDRAFSGVRGPNFTNLGKNIGRSSQHCTFVSDFGYFAAFGKRGRLKVKWCQSTPNFAFFDFPVKIRGGMARSLYQLLKPYLRPNLPQCIWWPSTARLLSTVDWLKKRKKEKQKKKVYG